MLVGSCRPWLVDAGIRWLTAAVCAAAGVGTVIITVLTGVGPWYSGVTWLKTAFLSCGCLLVPGAATLVITTTDGEACRPDSDTLEEAGCWLRTAGTTMETAWSTLGAPSAEVEGCTVVPPKLVAGTWTTLPWTGASGDPDVPPGSISFGINCHLLCRCGEKQTVSSLTWCFKHY